MRTYLQKIFFLILISTVCLSQNKKSDYDFVDEKITKLPAFKSNDLDSLSKLLTKDFSTESEKARAVFVWVTSNISYNTQKYFAGKNRLSELSGNQIEGESPEEIISSRQAVCEGYSNFLKSLCNKAGISCEVVEGIGRPENNADLHAWNVINIDGEWKLLDVTWAAGGVNMNNKKYYKSFSNQYFFTSPAEFIKTHYPFDPMWQLLLHPINRNEYEAKKTISEDTLFFQYNDSINNYLKQDSISQLMATSRRTYKYDPRNKLAKQNFEMAINYLASARMNSATATFQTGVKNYNECIDIINKARQKQSTKLMNTNEAVLNQLVKSCRDSIEKAIEVYRNVSFTDNANSQILNSNIEAGLKNLKDLESIEKYIKKYFSTSKLGRIFVLSSEIF